MWQQLNLTFTDIFAWDAKLHNLKAAKEVIYSQWWPWLLWSCARTRGSRLLAGNKIFKRAMCWLKEQCTEFRRFLTFFRMCKFDCLRNLVSYISTRSTLIPHGSVASSSTVWSKRNIRYYLLSSCFHFFLLNCFLFDFTVLFESLYFFMNAYPNLGWQWAYFFVYLCISLWILILFVFLYEYLSQPWLAAE